jgi:excisionase family DNA binding protein
MSSSDGFTPKRVATMLHVSVDRIYEAIRSGDLAADQVDETYRITHDQLAEFTRHGNPFARHPTGQTGELLIARVPGGE